MSHLFAQGIVGPGVGPIFRQSYLGAATCSCCNDGVGVAGIEVVADVCSGTCCPSGQQHLEYGDAT